MKKFLLGFVGLIAIGLTPAIAADLPARAYTKAPTSASAPTYAAAAYDWSGFYIGANAGGGWAKDNLSDAGDSFGSHTGSGAVVGGQFGYRWQAGAWVFGLEAQGDWANLKGSHVDVATWTSKTDALGLFTGQAGYAWNNALIYAKGGAAITHTKRDAAIGGVTVADAGSATRWGGTVGVGLEYGFAPNWSVGVEYNHLFIGKFDTTYNAVPAPGSFPVRAGGDTDIVTARLNYRFGGPVVAKY